MIANEHLAKFMKTSNHVKFILAAFSFFKLFSARIKTTLLLFFLIVTIDWTRLFNFEGPFKQFLVCCSSNILYSRNVQHRYICYNGNINWIQNSEIAVEMLP